MIRAATLDDLNALVRIEKNAFNTSIYHLTPRRQFRYLLTKANAQIWIAMLKGEPCGYIILLLRKNTQFGRLYSIAVTSDHQGGEIGKALFLHAEKCIKQEKLNGMILEIRADNARHLERYIYLGYTIFGRIENYYPDESACIKLKKVF